MNRVIVLLLMAGIIQGCAHGPVSSVDERLDKKLAQETTIKNKDDLGAEATQLIDVAPGLTSRQRSELKSLKSTASAESDKLRSGSLKLRALLIEDVLSSHYNLDEVELIKGRIRDLEHQRISVFFRAIRDANTMLGRWASKNDRMTGEVLDEMTIDMFQYY